MRYQRLFCLATLALLVASLVLVAADDFVLPGIKHEPSTCPICALAQCLTTAQLPTPIVWTEPAHVRWLPPERVCIVRNESTSQSFCACAPPSLLTR